MSNELKTISEKLTLALKNTNLYDDWLSLLSSIEDLLSDKEQLEQEIRDLKQDIEDNYRPIPISEQVGISDRDFI